MRDTFDVVPIATYFVAEIESVAIECGLQPRRSVDEKELTVDIGFLAKISETYFRRRERTR